MEMQKTLESVKKYLYWKKASKKKRTDASTECCFWRNNAPRISWTYNYDYQKKETYEEIRGWHKTKEIQSSVRSCGLNKHTQ